MPEKEALDAQNIDDFDDPRLPDKSLFRIDEVMAYFSVSESCVRNWITHGHLEQEKIVGVTRITRESIIRCRFRKTFPAITHESDTI